ncbi:YqaJ-like viral recombinase domain-containing protein [Carex littledalei]|uniref:YqaJ-like viral recombinase domain-containing protein n=1 Tax=Carex littledalei TaxID=544730 RepID=A0A833RA55_9POAL|nr:YqaJ-like viral recombinase domain-containing protein [Carex littledalei]
MARATLPFTKPIRSIPSIQNCENFIPWKGTSSTSLQRTTPRPSLPLLLCTTSSALPVVSHLSSDVPQRSDEWFALRKDKLTTSSFSTALGFWSGNRRAELWHEKVFTPETPSFDLSAKAAMNWGVLNEAAAIEKYKSITGRDVAFLGFATHADVGSGWLGASPDGVLGCYPDGGILEVKCPFNKGKPELALPWKAMPYYYMPQVQGQMEVMNREWVDLFCWTPNGSSIFRVNRDRVYWELIHRILHDFWFGHVVPARQCFLLGKVDHAKAFEPQPKHAQTNLVLFKSRKLAVEAKLLCKDIVGHVEFFK